MNAKYNPGYVFQGIIVNKKKTRKIKHEHFPNLPHVQQLINIFENLHDDIRVTEVWFLQKNDKGDGFENSHYDYQNIGGGSNNVSFTVHLNLGKLNEANDIAIMNISPSNEEPSVLTRSSREEMMQKISLQEKEEINQLPKEDLHCFKSGMLYTKDIDYYMDYLQNQDEIMCRKIHRRKPSLFYNIGFIILNNTNNPKCNTMTQKYARGKNIFNMRYIFIPIHQSLHFTCALIYMEQMKIEYYNSLRFDNVTRHGCRHNIKMQEDTLQVLRDHFQNEHMKAKRKDLPNEWKLYPMYNVPQQDTKNTTDCGVFLCMYCNLVLNDCKLDFNQH
jgi:Ulp1 family protease